jgi:S-formylglutathione hydrolase FrmB
VPKAYSDTRRAQVHPAVLRQSDPLRRRDVSEIADRDHRVMAGISMGGKQTFQITLKHLDLSSYIGGFSGAGGLLMISGE